ncbi:MAG: glycosyltransferase [Flavobacteriales bacterium TMED191]|nr:MAG: glycosyltransferase [Flavobacteriales bacterium TMED191]
MSRKKIIILTSRYPFPLDKGDKLRIYHQIKNLSIVHDIYLISINTESPIQKHKIKELKKFCKEVHVLNTDSFTILFNTLKSFIIKEPLQVGYFYSKKNQSKINKIIKKIRPDWVFSQLIRTSKYLAKYENNIIDYMDTMSKGIERRISNFPKIIQPLINHEFHITKKYENYIFDKFKKHTIITKNDQQYISHKNNKIIQIIPNGVDTKFFKPNTEIQKKFDIVFIGNMSYPPNVEAATYLCKKILPLIEKQHKSCNILIGGTNPSNKVLSLRQKNIHISGWVEDIRDLYSLGRVFVAPMFIGTGLQNKLLEAMSMGIPCITTDLANNALLASKEQIITANSKNEFANSCIKILKNKELYNKLRDNGLKFVKKTYDWKKINNKLGELFN